MKSSTCLCQRHRFPSEIFQYAVWLFHRFNLSHRDIEDLLPEKVISVSYESIRLWCNKCGPHYARRLRRRHQGFGDTFFFDEVFVKILGDQHYLWRDVDQDSEVVDVLLQSRRGGWAAKRFFIALGHELKMNRMERKWTQAHFAKVVRSSQSRVAKMESGDPPVSLDLLVRSLLATGASREDLAKAITNST